MINNLKFFFRQQIASKSFSSSFLSIIVPLIIFFMTTDKISFVNNIGQIILILIICSCSSTIDNNFKHDFDSGNLEFLFISNEVHKIVIGKFIVILILCLWNLFASLVLSMLLFGISALKIYDIIIAAIPSLINLSCLCLISGIIRIYFEKNSGLLTIFIFPLIIPLILLFSIYAKEGNISVIYISYGIALCLAPIFLYLTTKLTVDLYNS